MFKIFTYNYITFLLSEPSSNMVVSIDFIDNTLRFLILTRISVKTMPMKMTDETAIATIPPAEIPSSAESVLVGVSFVRAGPRVGHGDMVGGHVRPAVGHV